MTQLNDHELLAEFAQRQSDLAFAELVARYVDLVYSVARRFSGNGHHAEEITQAVFLILSRKAAKLSERVVLSGWLYQTARLTAANFVKVEIRRQKREQEAYMQSTMSESDPAAWEQIAPWLDEAMGQLGETDRNAVVLRYFQNKTAAETAAALRLTEAAAHKRVNRALEKLRKIFSRQRGVTLSAAVLACAVSAGSVHAAPVGLTATVTAATVPGVTLSAVLTTLVNGTMKTMTWLKLKFAVSVSVTALVVGGVATVAVSQTGGDPALTTTEIFQKAQAAYAALDSYQDNGQTVSRLNGTTVTQTFAIKLARPDLYRIEWQSGTASAFYTSTTTTQAVWSAGQGDFLRSLGGEARRQKDKEAALSGATGISGGASATIPGTFFKMNWGGQLSGPMAKGKRLADEQIGSVDCYVFASDLKGRIRTIWIGKTDFLIHQIRTVTSAETMNTIMADAAKRHPEIAARLPKQEYTESVSTETHENIVVNPKLSPADFAP